MNLSDSRDTTHALPLAGGQPISSATANQAADWLTLLMSGEATDEDRQRWQQWRAAHADHERAWQHIEAVTGRLRVMEPKAAYKALSPYAPSSPGADAPRSPGRRKALHMLMWGGVACTTGLLASRTNTWQQVAADYRTSIGEQRSVTLDDGTQITLNTGSAINVRFDGTRRLVRLVVGEVLIVTGHATGGISPDTRPFVVETTQGDIRALGTRFNVRQWDGHTQVAVLESAVEITPRDATAQARVLRAGEQVAFTHSTLDTPLTVDDQAAAWSRGQIVADNVRLADFMADLGRYRPGLLRCDPAVANLRFSGVFPLHDTDRILATLPDVLPVQVKLRTRYWVTVEAAR
jgi:transmembrane sensor